MNINIRFCGLAIFFGSISLLNGMEHNENSVAPYVTVFLISADPQYQNEDLQLYSKDQNQRLLLNKSVLGEKSIDVSTVFNDKNHWSFQNPIEVNWKNRNLINLQCNGIIHKEQIDLNLMIESEEYGGTSRSTISRLENNNEVRTDLILLLALQAGAILKIRRVIAPRYNAASPSLTFEETKIDINKIDIKWIVREEHLDEKNSAEKPLFD